MYRLVLFLGAIFVGTNIVISQQAVFAKSTYEVGGQAYRLTSKVELIQDKSTGTAVIVKKEGNLYTLITNSHVICGLNTKSNQLCNSVPGNESYKLTMFDGRSYTVNYSNIKILDKGLDLATIQFESDVDYPVAEFAPIGSSPKAYDKVYTTGYSQPKFGFYPGQILASSNKRVEGDDGGYTVIYDATTLRGMSGGGVFNSNGQLIAIQGRGSISRIGSSRGIPAHWLVQKSSLTNLTDLDIKTKSDIEKNKAFNIVTADEYFIAGYNKSLNLGNNLLLGRKEEINLYDMAISLEPKYSFAYYRRGYAYGQIGQYSKSLADFDTAISLNPKYPEAYNSRAVLKSDRLNDSQGALLDLNKAIAIDPKYAEAYNSRANLKSDKLNDFQGALTDFSWAVSINPEYAEAFNNRAILKKNKLANYRGALADYSQAIFIDPTYAITYFNRGLLKKNILADRLGAIKDFREAAKLFAQQGQSDNLRSAKDNLQLLGIVE
jgi:tetratricopeptide (TPR) repeat protein